MNNKLLFIPMLGVSLLLGCGRAGQQTSSPAAQSPTSTEAASIVSAASVQVIPDGEVKSALWTKQPCSLDSDPNITVGKQNHLRGWFLGPSRQPAGKFSFVLLGEQDFAMLAETGVWRPDVGAYMKDKALSAAGYAFSSTFESVPKGSYDVRLMVKEGRDTYFCDTGKKLIVN